MRLFNFCFHHDWVLISEGIYKLGKYSMHRVKAKEYKCTKCNKVKLEY